MKLKIATRGSALALAQAQQVKDLLEKSRPGLEAQLVVIKTRGDALAEKPAAAGQEALKGLFVKEIEEELLAGRADLAVHSAKDLETELPEGLRIGAVLKREDPRDALVARSGGTLKELPAGARVGASSLRRQAQLKRLRRDLEILPVRGNVDTRLKKLDLQEYDALVLAAAGLKRLGLEGRISERLEAAHFLPAPGQGTLALEVRPGSAEVEELLRAVDDEASRRELEAERSLLKALGGNCNVPVGALARASEGNLTLEGVVLSPDGLKAVRQNVSGSAKAAHRLGIDLASHLRAVGADRLLYGAWEKP